jgi:hypothetical protein
MLPTLPRGLRPGAEVWALLHFGGGWIPAQLGRVKRVTRSGYEVQGKTSRLLGYTECPLFTTKAAAEEWAREHPPAMPTAPTTPGNVR